MLPIAAETDAMWALRPVDVFIYSIGPENAVLGNVVVVTDRQTEASDARSVQIKTVQWVIALRRIGRAQLVAEVGIRSPKFIHQAGSKNAGQSYLCLVRIVAARYPGGFKIAAASEVGVAIQAVAEIGVVLVAHLVIQPVIEQLASERQLPDVAEWGEERIREVDCPRAHLIGVFEVGEEKEAILFDWTAKVNARIAPREERV